MKDFLYHYRSHIGIILLSLLPMLGMLINPDHLHTSDGAMHLARIAAYYKEITSGQFPVRWASELNYGYGTPIFNFFHPLPYIITTVFIGLGSSLSWSLRLSFVFSYLLSGIFAFLFAKEIFRDKTIAFTVAILYQFAPFRLVDIIVRGSLGGVYSYALLPMILYFASRYLSQKTFRSLLYLSISTALLSISHNIIGFTFFGVSLILILALAKSNKDRLYLTAAMFWGVILSAWFVVPVFLEQKYTYGYLFTKDLYQKHFAPLINLFIPNLTNDPTLRVAEVSVQIGFIHLLGVIYSLWLLLKNKVDKQIVPFYISLLIGSLIVIFFTNSASEYFWKNIPILSQFQYPWRLLSVITFSSALLSASLLYISFKKRGFISFVICITAIISTVAYWNPPEGYDKLNESYWWNYPLTTNYYGEVDTIWSDGPAKDYPKKTAEPIEGQAVIHSVKQKGVRYEYTVDSITNSTIFQSTQYFPGWSVYVDGQKTPIEFQNQLYRGKITYKVPKGTHSLVVVFSQSKIQQISNLITLAAGGISSMAFILLKNKRV